MNSKNLATQIEELMSENNSAQLFTEKFIKRAQDGNLTRDENPQSHICVYFAAIDPQTKSIFIGHHKKSGFWLFNGGHVDKGETIDEAVIREISEEWGMNIKYEDVGEPRFFTITPINNPTKQTCTEHFDIWHFISVSKDNFNPDQEKLAEEFYDTKWLSLEEAQQVIDTENTRLAVEFIQQEYFDI